MINTTNRAWHIFRILLITVFIGSGSMLFAGVYKINTQKSRIGWIGSKAGVLAVPGEFKQYSGKVSIDKNNRITRLEGLVKVDSVSSNNNTRDKHIRGRKLIESSKYPNIKFVMTKYQKISNTKGKVYGTLTLHGMSKKVTLDSILTKQGKAYILKLKGAVDIKKDFSMISYAFLHNTVQIDVELFLQ